MKTPSAQPVLRSRLLPRISFKMMFALTTLSAILAAIARAAGNGGEFASAAVAMGGFLIFCFTVFVLLFLVSWMAASFRTATGLAMIVMAIALMAMELLGFGLATVSNWPLAVFFLIAGALLLVIPAPKVKTQNPFAQGQLPPQILPPREGPQ